MHVCRRCLTTTTFGCEIKRELTRIIYGNCQSNSFRTMRLKMNTIQPSTNVTHQNFDIDFRHAVLMIVSSYGVRSFCSVTNQSRVCKEGIQKCSPFFHSSLFKIPNFSDHGIGGISQKIVFGTHRNKVKYYLFVDVKAI